MPPACGETILPLLRQQSGNLMTLAFSPDETSPYVRVLLADQGIAAGSVNLAIDARDEMLSFLVQMHDGVRFQEESFGVHGIVSTVRPEEFVCSERFDAITVTSLFTHLPDRRFVDWLRVLLGLLRPGGVLLFSVHGEEVLSADCALPAE